MLNKEEDDKRKAEEREVRRVVLTESMSAYIDQTGFARTLVEMLVSPQTLLNLLNSMTYEGQPHRGPLRREERVARGMTPIKRKKPCPKSKRP